MKDKLRSLVVPAYVLLCIVLGGSSQGIWSNMVLQLLAIALIGWSVIWRPAGSIPGAAKTIFLIAALALLLVAIQLIPLPPAVWTALPGRDFLVEGYRLLGQPLPPLPISLAPYDSVATALALLPPLAVLAGMLLAGAYRSSWLAAAILIGTFAAVLLGALQVGSSNPEASPWYLYERTNFDVAVGFFANSNHMASLLVISVPILFALVRRLRDRSKDARAVSAGLMVGAAGALVLLVGIALNGSLAALLLGPPVIAISATMLVPQRTRLRVPLAAFGLLSLVGSLALWISPLHDELAGSTATSVESRMTMWSNTSRAIADQMPVGSGLGSFVEMYRHYEDPATVTRTYANHAHNDYLEIVLELGIPGILLAVLFLLWWAARTRSIWRSNLSDRYGHAASIVVGTLLVHSIVDYPLRTAALSSIMAACVAIMAQPRTRDSKVAADLWPTRHVAI